MLLLFYFHKLPLVTPNGAIWRSIYLTENNEMGVCGGANGGSEIMNNFDILFEVKLCCLNFSDPSKESYAKNGYQFLDHWAPISH